MTVAELIAELQKMPQAAEVNFVDRDGDLRSPDPRAMSDDWVLL